MSGRGLEGEMGARALGARQTFNQLGLACPGNGQLRVIPVRELLYEGGVLATTQALLTAGSQVSSISVKPRVAN